jgi:hypothetical protein
MNIEEFKKTIKCEMLVKTDNRNKFMFKSYLMMPVGKKGFKKCFLYSVSTGRGAKVLNECHGFFDYGGDFDKKMQEDRLVELFEKIIKDGFWFIENDSSIFINELGEEVDIDNLDGFICEILNQKTEINYINKNRLNEIREIKCTDF